MRSQQEQVSGMVCKWQAGYVFDEEADNCNRVLLVESDLCGELSSRRAILAGERHGAEDRGILASALGSAPGGSSLTGH